MREEPSSGLNAEPLAEHLPGEIFVSGYLDELELMYGPWIDPVDDTKQVGSGFLFILDGSVEVAAALQVVEQIPLPLVQQVIVESILLIDRDISFQHAAADVKTLSIDDDDWSGLNLIRIVDSIR